jgi:hypothetical protein
MWREVAASGGPIAMPLPNEHSPKDHAPQPKTPHGAVPTRAGRRPVHGNVDGVRGDDVQKHKQAESHEMPLKVEKSLRRIAEERYIAPHPTPIGHWDLDIGI